jgi:hypothetical protein
MTGAALVRNLPILIAATKNLVVLPIKYPSCKSVMLTMSEIAIAPQLSGLATPIDISAKSKSAIAGRSTKTRHLIPSVHPKRVKMIALIAVLCPHKDSTQKINKALKQRAVGEMGRLGSFRLGD